MSTGRLVIYDAENSDMTRMGTDTDADRYLAIHNMEELANKWDQFVHSPGGTYSRVVFVCHGGPGFVLFNVQDPDVPTRDYLDWGRVPKIFGGRDYRHVFPTYMRVYFPGCNCAETDMGWLFLDMMARNLCSFQGGLVFGWTGKGYFWPWSDHMRHFSGDCRYVDAGPGGDIRDTFSAVEVASVGWGAMLQGDPSYQRRRDLMEDN